VNKPRITAILPCYNHARFLAERIRSVLAQTLPVSQIVFLDDASTDGSIELAKQLLQDCPAEVVFNVNTCNSRSPFSQWNKGISLSDNDLIWIAETDDSCHPDLLSSLYNAIQETEAGLAFSASIVIDEQGVSHGELVDYMPTRFKPLFQETKLFIRPGFLTNYLSAYNIIPNASAVLFSKSLYNKAGGAPSSFRFAADWIVWLSMSKISDVAYVSKPYNYYRYHATTTRVHSKDDAYLFEVFEARTVAFMPCVLEYGHPIQLTLRNLASFFFFTNRLPEGLGLLLGALPPRLCWSLPMSELAATKCRRLFIYSFPFKLSLLLGAVLFSLASTIHSLAWGLYMSAADIALGIRKTS
jgi:glycosyltransferase involved in cell wall biosynthesis